MKVAKRIAKNTFYVFSAQAIIKILHVVFIIYSARLLGASLYGLFVLVNTMIFICSTFPNFGIRAMIVRRISRDKANSELYLSNILTLRLGIATLVYLLLIFFVGAFCQRTRKQHHLHASQLLHLNRSLYTLVLACLRSYLAKCLIMPEWLSEVHFDFDPVVQMFSLLIYFNN